MNVTSRHAAMASSLTLMVATLTTAGCATARPADKGLPLAVSVRCEFQIEGELPGTVVEDGTLMFIGALVFEFTPDDYETLATGMRRYPFTEAAVTLGTDTVDLRGEFRSGIAANDVNGSTIDVIIFSPSGGSDTVRVDGLRYQSDLGGPLLDAALPEIASVYETFNRAVIHLTRLDEDGQDVPGATGDATFTSQTPGQCLPS